MDIRRKLEQAIHDHIDLAGKLEAMSGEIVDAVRMVTDVFSSGGKLLLAGNGGSAADAQHWAAEWVIRLSHDLDRPPMPAIALSTDTSSLTAGANDLGFENVFIRQIEGLARPGDLLILISTSGNSENLLRAASIAGERGISVLGVLGTGGGKLAGLCDKALVVPSDDVQRIQEMHAIIGHLLCELSERDLYDNQ